MNIKTLRGLSIGAGYFSQFHLEAWKRIPGVDLVGLCDVDEDRMRAAAERFSIPHRFADAREAVEVVRPDFVDIVTPPPSHLELVDLAARNGLPVICQKPLAPDWPTARRIVETARSAGIRFMVHENFRFQPWYREIRRLLRQGAIGERLHTLHFRTRTGDGWGEDAYLGRQPYFREMPRLLLHETGVHVVDTFRFLAGDIDEVHAVLRRLNPVIRGEDAGLLTLRFATGAIGVWDANRYNEGTAEDPRYTFGELLVEGSGGSIRLYPDGRITVQRLGQPEIEHVYHHERLGFGGDCVYFTQRHFVERLRDGGPFETGGADYLETLAVVEAAYASAEQGRPLHPVAVDDVAGSPAEPGRRIVDLSLPIENGMRGVTIRPARRLEKDGWNATTLSLYSHAGTHMDAPGHFVPGGASIDAQDLTVCCGPARLIDLTPVDSRELIGVERLGTAAERVGAGDRLLFRTDWYRRHGTPAYRDELPRISVDLARWLVGRGVALVGVEAPSVADVNDLEELTEVHRILLEGAVVIVEGLAHLDRLVGPDVEFIALPLKIRGGDGTPVRAVAIES